MVTTNKLPSIEKNWIWPSDSNHRSAAIPVPGTSLSVLADGTVTQSGPGLAEMPQYLNRFDVEKDTRRYTTRYQGVDFPREWLMFAAMSQTTDFTELVDLLTENNLTVGLRKAEYHTTWTNILPELIPAAGDVDPKAL